MMYTADESKPPRNLDGSHMMYTGDESRSCRETSDGTIASRSVHLRRSAYDVRALDGDCSVSLRALREEVVRGLSPGRSRSKSPGRSPSPFSGLLRRKKVVTSNAESLIARSGSLRPVGEALTPLREGPDPDGEEIGGSKRSGLGQWVRGQLTRNPSVAVNENGCNRRSDLRLLLGVMGAPLAPVHASTTDPLPHLSIKDTPIETSSAQYILQQYTATSGGQRIHNAIKNAYAMGKLRMVASEFETATKVVKNRNAGKFAESWSIK